MVLSDEIHNVELSYADQTVEITETSTSFYNERQKVNVNLEKWLETNEPFDIGTNEEIKKVDADYPDNKLTGAVFEIYSDTNADGKLDKDDKLLGEIKETDTGIYEMDNRRKCAVSYFRTRTTICGESFCTE